MLFNNIRIAIRTLLRNPSYTVINLVGMVLGLVTCILIFLYVQFDLSYDRYHEKADRIVRAEFSFTGNNGTSHWATTDGFVQRAIASRYPEIEFATKIFPQQNPVVLRYGDKQFSERGVVFADSMFFDIFSYKVLEGNVDKVLHGNNSVVLTKSAATRYFGDEPAVGKMMEGTTATFMVAAVIEDVPAYSHFRFDMIMPLNFVRPVMPVTDGRGSSLFYTYFLMRSEADIAVLASKLEQDSNDIFFPNGNKPEGAEVVFLLQPITQIHLHSHAEKEFQANGNMQSIWILSVVAVFVLLIACVNYMNLATARSLRRAKEIGMRKVLGAYRTQLAVQFIGESLVLVLVAEVIAALLVSQLVPYVNALTGKAIESNLLANPEMLLLLLGVLFVVGIGSGIYPAIYLSSFRPLVVMRALSEIRATVGVLNLRRTLVVLQFAISVFLIVSAVTVYMQIRHIQTKDLGFDKEHVLVLPLNSLAAQRTQLLKQELGRHSDVIAASASSGVPGKRIFVLGSRVPALASADPNAANASSGAVNMRTINTDEDFEETMGLEFVEGHGFSPDRPSELTGGFVINEATVRSLGLPEPVVGLEWEYLTGMQEPKRGRIIGVVRDFDYNSVHTEVEPVMIQVQNLAYSHFSIRTASGSDLPDLLNRIEASWRNVIPEVPFEYQFLDESYDQLYKAETTLGVLISWFTVLAIVIACLGLYGLSAFMAEQRTREIGIRKVLGATTPSLVGLLSKEFIVIVVVGSVLAFVPAWFFLSDWLQNFVYRIDPSPFVFVTCAVVAVAIAFGTVAWQAVKASQTNPVITLRAN